MGLVQKPRGSKTVKANRPKIIQLRPKGKPEGEEDRCLKTANPSFACQPTWLGLAFLVSLTLIITTGFHPPRLKWKPPSHPGETVSSSAHYPPYYTKHVPLWVAHPYTFIDPPKPADPPWSRLK